MGFAHTLAMGFVASLAVAGAAQAAGASLNPSTTGMHPTTVEPSAVTIPASPPVERFPEPVTLAMFLVGLGSLGAGLRVGRR